MRPARRKSKPSSCLRALMKRMGGASGSMPTRSTPVCRTEASTPLRSAAGVAAGVADGDGVPAGAFVAMPPPGAVRGTLPR